jgi:hypothetical protein
MPRLHAMGLTPCPFTTSGPPRPTVRPTNTSDSVVHSVLYAPSQMANRAAVEVGPRRSDPSLRTTQSNEGKSSAKNWMATNNLLERLNENSRSSKAHVRTLQSVFMWSTAIVVFFSPRSSLTYPLGGGAKRAISASR